MTVLDILQKESDIAEYIFFNRNRELLSFEFGRNVNALLYGWADHKVIEYSKHPYFNGTQSSREEIIRHLNGEDNHIMYILKIILDKD